MTSSALLTCEDLRRWRRCARSLHTPGPAARAAAPDLALARVLRSSFPGATHIAAAAPEAAAAATRLAMASAALQRPGAALFGATFVSDDGATARVDVLQRGSLGWRVLKVRLATAGNDADVDDVAWWVHVAARSGVRVQQAALLLVDTEFVYPGCDLYAGLLREVDLAPTLGTRPVAAWIVAMRRAATLAHCPGSCSPSPGCEAPARTAADPQVALEALGRETARQLRAVGHATLLDVTADTLSEPRHRRMVQAVQQAKPVIEPVLPTLLAALPWPRHHLRLDTIGLAVPVWPGTKPYEALPFQWSCLTETAPGVLQTAGFLADGPLDPRRAFAQSLLATLGETGAVLAYNAGFERNRLRELARAFDDLAPALEALQPRIVDVFQWLRQHAYHPAMAGSWSFRSACRAWTQTPPAAGFEAAETFALSWHSPERATLRAALQDHGQRETQALRDIVQALLLAPDGADRTQDLCAPDPVAVGFVGLPPNEATKGPTMHAP